MILQHMAIAAPLVAGVLLAARCVHLLIFHPLAKVPGPKSYALTDAFYLYYLVRGRWPAKLKTLHDEYGPTLRFGPSDVSSIAPETWKTVYAHRTQQQKTFEKDRKFFGQPYQGVDNILIADKENHRRVRRVLAHAFSEKSLHEQEGLITSYINLFISKLAEKAAAHEPADIVTWFNFFTFDVIGDLSFGKPFDCLANGAYSPWVTMVFEAIANDMFKQVVHRYPILKSVKSWVVPAKLANSFATHAQLSQKIAFERIERGNVGRKDFMDYILRHNDDEKKGLSKVEIAVNSGSLISAGSETTATLLSGCMFYLLTNRDKYETLAQEIRNRYSTVDSINIHNVNELPYLSATLKETFRMYPPVPVGLPRVAPEGGDTVAGYFIPENTSISVPHFCAYHSESNFADAETFVPERWLGDPRYDNDKRDVLQPFSTGPRDCLGKNLAYAEMRLMMVHLLWHFDLELMPESRNWAKQRVFILWEKPALMVKLMPVQRF
ncbi:cytochrome P450 [Microdochium trichocladiopsis]|uniref:Cytochrome P450 n=1 Tax=Microdochium trichocladiopsis TaxID=1682393 RepID=A0A9P9BLI3_9PEZI|nr:cytochrome P450 [Microdochium trichocladiopsis]KAH7024942.1 cytochrome P450 [Microdochium trichocladiopsis]